SFNFASYYENYMVLQRAPHKAVIWGYSPNIGERIIVKMSDTEKIYKSIVSLGPDGVNGVWKVSLDPENRTDEFTITAISSQGSISIAYVLFGDVWLCSGQSNMQFTLIQAFNGTDLANEASKYPNVRVLTVLQTQSNKPEYDLITIQEPWSLPNQKSIGFAPWKYFSAVCWLYGRNLYDSRQYPIGMIATDWGGTPVEAWSSKDALQNCGLKEEGSYKVSKEWTDGNEDLAMGNSDLWNAMIHPFLNMTIYGAIWYQGEANQVTNVNLYNCTFPSMIDDWRLKFSSSGNTDPVFPFGFVQVTNRPDPTVTTGFTDIRWHQTADFGYVPNKKMPKVFMAVAMDLPDFVSPYGSIHPRDKVDVGNRLTLSGLAIAYNDTSVKQWSGPLPTTISLSSKQVQLEYDVSLEIRNLKFLPSIFQLCCSIGGSKSCTAGKSWWLPTPIISSTSTSITIYSICDDDILGVRYAWRETPCQFKQCAVYSSDAKLPGPPFIWYRPTGSNSNKYPLLWDEPVNIH
ncbi:hypothetical protein LOTGIDRAFT_133483, partial [Lottia gigantea]